MLKGIACALALAGSVLTQTAAWGQSAPQMRTRYFTSLSNVEVEQYLKRNDVIFVPVGTSESFGTMWSVPAGRSGRTRYRSSAVLSQTRTSTSSGKSSPNSLSTPRGSITVLERYAADLYQTGGRPRTGHG